MTLLSSFDELLQAACQQPEPQRLLFVFAGAVLPEDADAAQRAGFEAGHGGALAPLMCVDKLPQELTGFAALAEESRQFGQDWALVFVAAMSGSRGRAPSSEEAVEPLDKMVDAIKAGSIASFIPFDRRGEPVSFS